MFMEMSTLFLKKIKKFLSLFLWLFALGNDRINEVVFQKEKSGMEGIALDKTAECKLVLIQRYWQERSCCKAEQRSIA